MDGKSIEYAYHTIKLEGSIVIMAYRENLDVDLTMAQTMAKERLEFFGDKTYPALADVRGLKSITKEARDYLATSDGIKGISAGALLVNGFLNAIISNLYISFSKPPMPTRIFSNRKDAMKWLQQFVVSEHVEIVSGKN